MAVPDHNPATFEGLRTQSLPSLVQEEIIRMIRDGELAEGDKINEAALAAKLNVSRGPIREAFQSLIEIGLLLQIRNRGVYVRSLSIAEIEDIYAVRGTLERLVGELVVERIKPMEIDELNHLVERMQKASEALDIETYYPINLNFHSRILEISGNQKLITFSQRLIDELHLIRRHNLVQVGSMSDSNLEHRNIVGAIMSGDPVEAGNALWVHVISARKRLIQSLK